MSLGQSELEAEEVKRFIRVGWTEKEATALVANGHRLAGGGFWTHVQKLIDAMKHRHSYGGVDGANHAHKVRRMTHLWQPIFSAPRDGTAILVYEPDQELADETVYVCRWAPRKGTKDQTPAWVEASGEGYFVWQPTHWMPLPEPPKP